jgi:beta-lactamase regulating signal transducer with metallopeptidase domain
MSADLLALVARMTFATSAAIVVILLLRHPLRAAFGAQIAYAFWLLAPISTLAALLPAPRIVEFAPTAAETAPIEAAAPAAAVHIPQIQAMSEVVAALPIDAAINAPVLLFIWLSGAVFGVLQLLRNHSRFMRNLAGAGPAVVGVLRPRIVLPRDFEARYTPAERDLVLAHERAHLAAFDAQINALAALVQCFNWFNPLIHFARKALRVDQELACDARVMARHADAKRVYAEAMLKTQLSAQPIPLGCQWPAAGAKPLKQRITMLSQPLPSRTRTALGAALCAFASVGLAITTWIAQPPRSAFASELSSSAPERALGRQLVESMVQGEMDEAREFIAAGANVNQRVLGDGAPLIIAAREGNRDMVALLLQAGADPNLSVPGDGNPLIMAALTGDMEIIAMLVNAGADVNGYVYSDETPLINAARENRLAAARYLIEHGADVNFEVDAPTVRGRERRSAMIMARQRGHEEMIRLLRAHGATD